MPRLEDRIGRPANPLPSLEARLSNPAPQDDRQLRPRSRSRPPRSLPATSEHPPLRPADTRSIPISTPADRPAPHSEERAFTPADHFARPSTPAGSDRDHASAARRAPSIARDEPPRSFLGPSSPARSPARSDVREFRPAVEPQARDRLSYRPGPELEQGRYTSDRRPGPSPAAVSTPASVPVSVPPPAAPISTPASAPASAGPEPMDVDNTRLRPTESRMSYRRPSPSPAEYPPRDRDRSWVPAGEIHREPPPEPSRRLLPSPPHSYPPRDWRGSERSYTGGDNWVEQPRAWDRDRDRDIRYVERNVLPHAWETREERERRDGYPVPPDVPPPARPYDRSLSARLTDPYPDDRTAYLGRDRSRYGVEPPPPSPPPGPSYSRVRPRSPSPARRSGASDDIRPPIKRARDDTYYYPDTLIEHYPPPPPLPLRIRTPPPPPVSYYDDLRYPASPGREREYMDVREREYGAYERRADVGARMPRGRTPPPLPYAYGRDDRRY
ncbi:hypothetical protein BC628DRAFT_941127 [Trametes gibbosa]|nr:hypothetical protein BC628DRAFT_941127 [Trametes gibbosa]